MFYTLLSNNIGTSMENLKYNFTIDQVHLLYEKCKRQEMDSQKSDAITLAQSMLYTNPYADRNKAQNAWTKFMNSLTWENIEKDSKEKTLGSIKSMFATAGIPMKKRDGK